MIQIDLLTCVKEKITNYTKHTLANKGIDVWNNLPTKNKEPRSYASFKSIIKKYFLQLDLTI